MIVAIRLTPRAARSEIQGVVQDRNGVALGLRVNAPPAEGRANRAAIALLAEQFDLAPSRIKLVAGAGARSKRVHIAGDPAELLARLSRARI